MYNKRTNGGVQNYSKEEKEQADLEATRQGFQKW